MDAFEILEGVDVKVGNCTIDQLMQLLTPCMRKFYMNYRVNPNIDCLSNYNKMRNCVRDEVRDCFKDTEVSDEMADEVAQSVVVESLPMEDAVKSRMSVKLWLTVARPFPPLQTMSVGSCINQKFCERSGVESPVPDDDDQVLYCSKEFYAMTERMTANFNSLYSKDRGSPSLCQAYEDYGKKFLELSKVECKPSFYRFVQKQMNWAESRKMNPFCSDEQVSGGS